MLRAKLPSGYPSQEVPQVELEVRCGAEAGLLVFRVAQDTSCGDAAWAAVSQSSLMGVAMRV